MELNVKILQILLFLAVTVSSAEALYKPGNFLIIMISVLLPAAVLIGFCGVVVFVCKNRKRIPLLRSKFGTHEKLPSSAPKGAAAASAPPMMPPPQAPPPQGDDGEKKGDDEVKPAVV